MTQDFKLLEGVVVQSDVPIKVKGDTIAYNANSFKVVKPNGTAEDLLKKLPGVEVSRDGTVKAQGENVNKIYVDGKEFFGNDPRMATKNLTSDMIAEVEVYDDMSEQAKFSGVDDGSRSRVMNFKLKKNKNSGVFGRGTAGYGTDDRYTANLSANYFKGATKLSVVGRSNNTNNLGFTNTDGLGIFTEGSSGGRGGGSGGSGITSSSNAGINYSDTWGKKVELTSSYSFNNTNNRNDSRSNRLYSFPTYSLNRTEFGTSKNTNENHRANLRLTYEIDSLNSIVFLPNVSLQSSNSTRIDSLESFNIIDKILQKANDSRSIRDNSGTGTTWANNITFRHRTHKRGRTFSINLSNSTNDNDRDGSTLQRLGYFRNGSKTRDSLVNQISDQNTVSGNYGAGFSYTEPIGRDKTWEFNYQYRRNNNESDRYVYDLDTITGKHTRLNDRLTNLFENSNESNRLGTNFRVVKKKYNYQFGVAAQRTTLVSDNVSKSQFVEQTYTNLFPTASFNYQFARSKALRFQYRGSTNQPSTNQLQDIVNYNNALYLTRGNPSLKQEYDNNFQLSYNFFNMTTFKNYFLRVGFSNTMNRIVNSVISLPGTYRGVKIDTGSGVQLTEPVNANGSYNANANFNMGFPIKRLKGGNFNTTTSLRYGQDISLVDFKENFSKSLNLSQSFRLSYTYKEKLDITLATSIAYSSATYTVNKNQNNAYYTYMASGDISYLLPKNFVIMTDVDFAGNTGLAAGFNQPFYLWNASFSKLMLKNNRGELKLSVYDLLKQNRSISRRFGSNYIEDVQNSAVQRFFMLTFTYNLNRMGSSGNTRTQGGGRNFEGGGRGAGGRGGM
jgi:hypothetical protein